MKLVHYSDAPVGELKGLGPAVCGREYFKPRGLWVSDDDCENNWREWCLAERFGLDRLTHVHDVNLAADASVLVLRSAADIRAFNREWLLDDPAIPWPFRLRWPDVQTRFDGLIITPYIWEMRLDMEAGWYYGWDCASGCIWEPRAIASVRLREVVEISMPADQP